jgi:hypothetical protein
MARNKRSLSVGDMEPVESIDFFGNSFETPFEANDKKTLDELEEYEMQYIPLDKIVDNKKNEYPNKTPEEMEEFQESIWLVGVLQPINVIREVDEEGNETGKYEIRAGSQRFRAVHNLYKRAIEERNEAKRRKFSKIPAIVVPRGATQKEIEKVYHDTNLLSRNLSAEKLMIHYDYIFGYENGVYTKLEGVVNKAEYVVNKMKRFGFSYSLAKAKKVNAIYFAHNTLIKEYFRKELINFNQAYLISSLTDAEQDRVMKALSKMDRKGFSKYLFDLQMEIEGNKDKNYTGNEIIKKVRTFKTITTNLTPDKIIFADNDEKKEFKNYLLSLEADIKKLRQSLK